MNKLEKISKQREKASKEILLEKKKNDSYTLSIQGSVKKVCEFLEKEKPNENFKEEINIIKEAKSRLNFYLGLMTEKKIMDTCKKHQVKEDQIRKILNI